MSDSPTSNTPYRGGTAEFLNAMKSKDFEERKKIWDQIVLKEGKELRMELLTDGKGNQQVILRHVSGLGRINSIIVDRRNELKSQGVSHGEYARQYLDRSAAQIGNILNGATCPRDVAINGILMMRTPFTVAETDHVLMEMGMAGLFTDTYLPNENIRNYILKQLLEHIRRTPPQKDGYWLKTAWNMMDYLGLPPLGTDGSGANLSSEERSLADAWYEEAKTLGRTNYMLLRKTFYQRFQQETGKNIKELSEATVINIQTCRDLLYSQNIPTGGRRGNRGQRNSLICLCACLGCTLEESNRILREANYALLYPPIEMIGTGMQFPQLLQNDLDRASTGSMEGDIKIYDPYAAWDKTPPAVTDRTTAEYIIKPKE